MKSVSSRDEMQRYKRFILYFEAPRHQQCVGGENESERTIDSTRTNEREREGTKRILFRSLPLSLYTVRMLSVRFGVHGPRLSRSFLTCLWF